MRSTPNHPTTRLGPRIITHLFVLSVVVFLLGGLAIVVGQAVILAGGDATGARHWAEALTPIAFGGASVAGLLAFVLTYWHGENEDGHDTDEEEDTTRAEQADRAASTEPLAS